MPIKKLVPRVPDPYIGKNELNQFWPARFGHLDYLIDQINENLGGSVTNGVTGSLKVLSGTITSAQWTTLNSSPIALYTASATTNFLPMGGLVYYSYDAIGGVPPCESIGVYYSFTAPSLILDVSSWGLGPTSGIMQLNPSAAASASAAPGDILKFGSGSNPDCPGTIMNDCLYFIFGIEVTV